MIKVSGKGQLLAGAGRCVRGLVKVTQLRVYYTSVICPEFYLLRVVTLLYELHYWLILEVFVDFNTIKFLCCPVI